MFLIFEISAKFKISFSSNFLTNLIIHLSKCVNFNLFNQILLSLSDISSAFHDSI